MYVYKVKIPLICMSLAKSKTQCLQANTSIGDDVMML